MFFGFALKVIFLMSPLLLTGSALIIWRRSLARPWLFGITGFLALCGLEIFIPRLVEYALWGETSPALHNIIVRASSDGVNQGTSDKLAELALEGLSTSFLLADLLVIALGVPLLWQLQKVWRRL